MKLFRTSAVLAAAVLGLTAVSARATLVDDFSNTTTTWPLLLPNGSTSVTTSEAFTDGIAAIRSATITMAASSSPTRPAVDIYVPATHAVFEFTESSYHTAAVNLAYSGFTADWTGTHFLDLAIDTYDYPSLQGLPVAVSVNGSAPVSATYFGTGPGDLFFDLALTGANLSNVTSLSLSFTPPKGADFSISEIDVVRTSIPEPSSMAMLAPAGLVLLRRRSR